VQRRVEDAVLENDWAVIIIIIRDLSVTERVHFIAPDEHKIHLKHNRCENLYSPHDSTVTNKIRINLTKS